MKSSEVKYIVTSKVYISISNGSKIHLVCKCVMMECLDPSLNLRYVIIKLHICLINIYLGLYHIKGDLIVRNQLKTLIVSGVQACVGG